jgi:hypothetical protein
MATNARAPVLNDRIIRVIVINHYVNQSAIYSIAASVYQKIKMRRVNSMGMT